VCFSPFQSEAENNHWKRFMSLTYSPAPRDHVAPASGVHYSGTIPKFLDLQYEPSEFSLQGGKVSDPGNKSVVTTIRTRPAGYIDLDPV
jgi:hypothetical protein